MRCICAAILLTALSAFAQKAEEARALFRQAQRLEAAGDSLNAYIYYARAADLEPQDAQYAFKMTSLQARVIQTSLIRIAEPRDDAERMAFRLATEQLSPSELIEGRDARPPEQLRTSADRQSFDLRGTARPIFEEVGRAFGITILFDPDYQPRETVVFRVRDLTRDQAFRSLEAITSTFLVPVAEDRAVVYADTTQNRQLHEPAMSVAIPIPERMSIQEAQEMASGVQQTMELRRIAVDAGRRVIFMRDLQSKILGARKVLSDLSRPRTEVVIEVEILAVSSTSALAYGLALPTSAPIANFSTILNNVVTVTTGSWATFGGGQTLFGLGIASAQMFATISRSSSQAILKSQLVTVDGQQVSLHVGDRYPIVTGRLGDPQNPSTAVPTSQFTDLGLILTITPVAHEGEVTLNVEAEYKALTGASNNGIPVISNREFQGVARLGTNQWAVLAGLAKTEVAQTRDGIPGLSQLPWLGRLFRSNTTTRESSQIMIVLKPKLVSLPPWEQPTAEMWVGSETKPLSLY